MIRRTLHLLTDETSRKGAKYMGYEASDSSGQLWVLGVHEMVSKSAADTLSVFKEVLSDIDYTCQQSDQEPSKLILQHIVVTMSDRAATEVLSDIDYTCQQSDHEPSKLILQHIVATMSDRAATEVKFNTLLNDYRETIMPTVIDNYDQMPESERTAIGYIANFFCGLHDLIHIAEASEKAISETEKVLVTANVPEDVHGWTNEAMTVRLIRTCCMIRTCCKAFAAGADEKNGVYGYFIAFVRAFLRQHNLHSLPIVPFRGSRFNISFDNAAGVFFLHHEMLRFLEQFGANNRLTKSVLSDLQTLELLASCNALGLIGRLVTQPLWPMIERKDVHILDMNARYAQLVEFSRNVNDHIAEFM